MQKEIEAEGEKEKVLYDDFMCFCQTGEADLAKTAEGAKAKIDELSATLETDTAEKATLDQELAEPKANIGALSGAIPALEKGMGGASLMQMPGSSRLTKIVQNAQNVDSYDRDSVVAFL